ncbi:XRE family transcriptional regulator [Actinokineospora guangxiensis]|uniref:XRE family transcriptional regulator n=1 Tax=Actinokineospora guangxiensis TaxID=1490288 RepID=A0ABW0ELM8_9PSEU
MDIPRSGAPFAAALDTALTASGLTLDQVRARLCEHGARVSNATLSYWRRDLRRPETVSSLRAVDALERVLALPPGALTGLVGPPRPRGRIATQRETPRFAALSSALADPAEGTCEVVSAHDVFTVGVDGVDGGVRSRLVLRGLRGRVTRHLVRYESDAPTSTPELVDVAFCGAGRAVTAPGSGIIVAELLLDRPLRPGGFTVVEYEMCAPAGPIAGEYYRRIGSAMTEYTQLVRFEGRPPARCRAYRREDLATPGGRPTPLHIGRSRTTCVVERGAAPGVVVTAWDW